MMPPFRPSPSVATGLLLAVVACVATMAAGQRDSVAFDFGWKHRTGLNHTADPDAPPPVNTDPGIDPPEAGSGFPDTDWLDVQLPHDGLIAATANATACPDGCSGKSFLPRHVLWYRKTFTLPSNWAGSAVWLDFEGSFRNTTVWVNGVLSANHVCGYTPFRLRLDNISAVKYGSPTVLAVYVDPDNGDSGSRDHGSGWWYEGGGLYRHVHLVRSSLVHVEQDGLFAYSNVTFSQAEAAEAASPTGTVHARVSVTNAGTASAKVCVSFNVTDPAGRLVATTKPSTVTVAAGGSATSEAEVQVAEPQLWSSSSPTLYTVAATISECQGSPLDSVSAVHGFRHLRYDANDGFFLNEKHFKVRGFCDRKCALTQRGV